MIEKINLELERHLRHQCSLRSERRKQILNQETYLINQTSMDKLPQPGRRSRTATQETPFNKVAEA